ncbi:porin family protein [Niabella beijingensis]|uniref:porin family protein n=1 Tax=Niabella beijingensis TaxID=2872700 RepID=UPI001CBD6356|nr:porin family protein [Niabella beijingensis]MBZ4192176.1 PorT family protein [Niabella beijingensis]
MRQKRLLTLLAAFIIAGTVNAQDFAKTKLGIKAGWNSANITNSREGNLDASKRFNTFNAGFVAAVPLGSTFELRSGLDFQSKGIKITDDDGGVKSSFKVNPLYLELPVNIDVMLPINEKIKAYIGAGPYAAVGLGGKIKSEVVSGGVTTSTSENIHWGNDNPTDGDDRNGTVGSGDMKRFDFGINAIGGVDFGSFGIHAQYGIGLTNTIPGGSNNNNANKNNQNRVIGVSGVFYF